MFVVTREKPVECKLHSVKKAEKGDGYKRKASWDLSELKSVDGRCEEGLFVRINVSIIAHS